MLTPYAIRDKLGQVVSNGYAYARRQGREYRFELIVGVLLLAACGYLVNFSLEAAVGMSQTVDTPVHEVRLEVINATGTVGVAGRFVGTLERYEDKLLSLEAAELRRFEERRIPQTLLVARTADRASIDELARRLGLDPALTVFEPRELNRELITATLILGTDYERFLAPAAEETKENEQQS